MQTYKIAWRKTLKWFFSGAVALILVLGTWQYTLVASPNVVLHIVDEAGQPMIGLRVTRSWDTSEGQKGNDETATDTKGNATFERVEFSMSRLKRVTKPLLVFVPAPCCGNWEIYGHAEFNVYGPPGFVPKLEDGNWKKVNATYENPEGISIYDASLAPNKNCIDLYVFNKRTDFEYTLKLCKNGKVNETK